VRRTLSAGLRMTRNLLFRTGLGNLRPVRAIYDSLTAQLKDPNGIALVQGHKMLLDKHDNLNLSVRGVFARAETDLCRKLIKPGDVVVDLGANIGYFTLIFAGLVGEHGHVFAFEPEAANFELLSRNVALNDYGNVTLAQKAVSSTNGTARLYVTENPTDHRLYDSHDGRAYVNVDTVRLGDFLAGKATSVDFIKMDIQGAEGRALEGMLPLFTANPNLKLMTEFWPYGMHLFGTSPSDFLQMLLDAGLSLYEVSPGETRAVSAAQLLEKYDRKEDGYSTDLLCTRDPR